MPAFRNIGASRHSGRLVKEIPVIWDMSSGWPVIDSVRPLVHHSSRDSPVSHTASTSPLTSPVPFPDQRVQLQEQTPPCAPSSPRLQRPTRKHSYTRRRDPTHIPRPRNAFIFFRSHFISSGSASGEGQQNELSKSAAKVWNRMSEIEKRPFAELAAKEKEEHTAKYPNYTYAPGRTKSKAKAPAAARKMSTSSASRKRRRSTSSMNIPDDWSNSATSPESFSEFSYPTPPPRFYRAPRAAAQRAVQKFVELPSPAPSSRLAPTPDEYATSVAGFTPWVDSGSPGLDSEFVPTADIPLLELTPSSPEEMKPSEPTFDISSIIPHEDVMPEQFGFKPYVSQEVANSWLPPLPRTNDSPPPFFTADGHYDMSSVYQPLGLQYPTQPPMLLSAGAVSGSYDFSYQPPVSYRVISQSYTFNAYGTMVEGPGFEDGTGMVGSTAGYDMAQYFDFDS